MSSDALPPPTQPLTDSTAAAELARSLKAAGSFALDLEFVSEDRYIPNLALVQVGWGQPDDPQVAAVDPLGADAAPLAALVAAEDIETLVHSGQGDLTLLAREFGIRGRAIFDTQIAGAFLGIGDQIGYGNLVAELLEIELDKAMQFTQWLRRPLTDEQVRYALDDVRYLPRLAKILRARLLELGRLAWVIEECDRLAENAAHLPPPEEAFRKVGGWHRLGPRQQGALRALAEWRERRALKTNRPPSWILKNAALQALAKELPSGVDQLEAIPNLPAGTRKRFGRELLRVIAQGAADGERLERQTPPGRLSTQAKKLGSQLSGFLQERCRDIDLAPRVVANRSDCDVLVRWWLEDDRDREPSLPLLEGWRRQVAGAAALEFLAQHAGS
jgi:ribonuclease D